MFIHGGGFFIGDIDSYLGFLEKLSIICGTRMFFVTYSLSPEKKYPYQIEEVKSAYNWLLSKQGGNLLPQQIFLAGDSAGGNLCCALTLELKDLKLPLPKALILMSPYVDLTEEFSLKTYKSNAKTDYLIHYGEPNPMYCHKSQMKLPKVSPVFGDLTGFPPMLIQYGGGEVLKGEIEQLGERAKKQGVKVVLDENENMPHVFLFFEKYIPNEVKLAYEKIGKFVKEN